MEGSDSEEVLKVKVCADAGFWYEEDAFFAQIDVDSIIAAWRRNRNSTADPDHMNDGAAVAGAPEHLLNDHPGAQVGLATPGQAQDRADERTCLLDVYTDGNHDKGTDSMGYGVYALHEGHEYGLSQRADARHMELFFGMNAKMARSPWSNPTMELAGVAHVIKLCAMCQQRPSNQRLLVRIHADYIGPRNWLSGAWRTRKPYIDHLVDFCRRRIEEASARGIDVIVLPVRGHAGDPGNDRADHLAKGRPLPSLRNLDVLFS